MTEEIDHGCGSPSLREKVAGETGRMRYERRACKVSARQALEHALAIAQHAVFQKAKRFPNLMGEVCVADVLSMPRPVGLDNQSCSDTKKVDDVGSDRSMPAKLETAQSPIAPEAPQAALRIGRRAARRAGAAALVCGDAFVRRHDISPIPQPARPPPSVAPSARHLPQNGEGLHAAVACSPSRSLEKLAP